MVTRSQRGIVKPLERLSLHTSFVSPIPKSPFLALKDPNWCNAMYDEYDALARLVANSSSQQLGVDFDETFSLVVKPATIHTVLSLAVSRQWPIHQLDVKNAFLNCDLSETVYMHQPSGFVNSHYPNHLLELAHMVNCNPSRTPVDTDSKLVQQGTLELGIHLYASATTSLVGYTDVDWAGFPSTSRSTSGYCVFLGDNLLSWSVKRQHTISRSSAEAEYRGVANVVAETTWIRNLLPKDIWEKIRLLMQRTSLTKQERECKLYDEFDKFTYKKGESLHEYYLRFTLLLNDMNIYKMPLEQFQVNTKFLNTLPAKWSKFVTDVKLVKDLHTTNVDQIHAHLEQHERHANEVRLMHERNSDPLALVASY
ncbi:ribonuclease H-like domain-containing protein [Tanacetum coccineum]